MTEVSSMFATIGGRDIGLQELLRRVETEMTSNANSAVRLGQQYARLAQAQGHPALASEILAGTMQRSGTASERAIVGLQTQASRLASGSTAFQQFGQAASSSLLGIVGPAAAAGVAVNTLIGVGQSFGDAFKFKADLDATTASINAQLSGVRDSAQVYAEAAVFADRYKITQEETTSAISASIGVMRSSKASVEDILGVLARLQVLSPEQSLQEAAIAVKALASGDTTSLVTRFEVGRDVASQMKTEIQGGADAVQVLSKFLDQTGIGMDTLAAKTTGAAGAMKDLAIAQEELKLAQAEFAQGPGLVILQGQIRATSGLTRLLSGDFDAMGQSLQNTGVAVAANAAAYQAYMQALAEGKTAAEANSIAVNAQANATAFLTGVQRDGGGGTFEFAAATNAATAAMSAESAAAAELAAKTQVVTSEMNAATAEMNANAQAAVLAAGQQQAQTAATQVLTAETNAAVNAFLALNPNLDAAGIASAIAAGKVPPLIGQLAALRLEANQTSAALAQLAAQQAGVRGLSQLFSAGIGEQRGATGGVGSRLGGGASQALAANDALRQSERDLALARAGSAAEQIRLLQAQADKTLDVVERNRLLIRIEGLRGRGAGGGGGGASVKLTDQQKLENQLLSSQEQYALKSEDAERAHLDRLLDIQADFAERMLDAQDSFAQSQLEGRVGFYDSLGSIEDAGLRQSLAAQYEAAFQEADQIARTRGADVGEAFLEAKQAALEAQAQRQSEIQQATEEGDKGRAEYLAGVDRLYREAEERKIARIAEGRDSLAAQQQEQIDDEAAKYAESQEKLGLSSERAADRAVTAAQRRGQAIDVEALKVGGLADQYARIGGVPTGGVGPGVAAAPLTAPPVATTQAAATAAGPLDIGAALAALAAKLDELRNALVAAEQRGADQVAGAVKNLRGVVS